MTLLRRIAPARAKIILIGLVALAPSLTPLPAAAEGLLDFLFGALRRQAPPPSANAYADPNAFGVQPTEPESGPSVAFCVRLCDGRYFPIQHTSGTNPAQVCRSSCPATRTQIFSGSEIKHATAHDGARYKDLRNAFVYRDRAVASCTCNGKDPYGLVTADVGDDPTLQPGDIVATEQGFVAYGGGGRAFTPLAAYRGLSPELRKRLAGARIEPREVSPRPEPGTHAARDQRAQLDR